jgi:thiamine pyrophosphokinase
VKRQNDKNPLHLRVLHLSKEKSAKRALIICDGELKKRLINKFVNLNLHQKQLVIIAADGASNFLYKHKIIPDFIIGDLDSLSPAAKKYFSNKKVVIKKILDQYKNDFEKCLRFSIGRKLKQISIIGFAGKRFDHTLNNLSVLKKYYSKANIKVYDDKYEYFIISNNIEFNYKACEIVSIMALPKAEGVKTTGLKYHLNNETLEFGIREGALNSSSSNFVKIEMRKGHLLIVKKHFGKTF